MPIPSIEDIVDNEISILRDSNARLRNALDEADSWRVRVQETCEKLRMLVSLLEQQTYESDRKIQLIHDASLVIKEAGAILDRLFGLLKPRSSLDNEMKSKNSLPESGLSINIISLVDHFGDLLVNELLKIGTDGIWGQKFPFEKAPGSDYWGAPVLRMGMPIRKKWIQLNGRTYHHPSYSSPKPWKIQARLGRAPNSGLWEKKPPYIYNRRPLEWSLGGPDVWAISYDTLATAITGKGEGQVLKIILDDLRQSWDYAGHD